MTFINLSHTLSVSSSAPSYLQWQWWQPAPAQQQTERDEEQPSWDVCMCMCSLHRSSNRWTSQSSCINLFSQLCGLTLHLLQYLYCSRVSAGKPGVLDCMTCSYRGLHTLKKTTPTMKLPLPPICEASLNLLTFSSVISLRMRKYVFSNVVSLSLTSYTSWILPLGHHWPFIAVHQLYTVHTMADHKKTAWKK